MCSHVQSCKLVHMSSISCLTHVSSTSGCDFVYFMYSTVQSTVVQYLYFQPMISKSKHKSSGDIAGTTVLFKVLYFKKVRLNLQIKNLFFISCVCFFYYLCESIISLLQHSTIQLIVSVGYLGYLCQVYEQIGLINVLLEWNLFLCRGLTTSRPFGH